MPAAGAWWEAAGGLLAAGLLGSIPFGYLAGRLKGIDVRTVGSGNIGATNVGRALGKPVGVAVFLLDVAKGWAATGPLAWLVLRLGAVPPDTLFYHGLGPLYALAACAGHVWTPFLGWRGGRGVATALGALLAVAPLPGVIGLALWALLVAIFRYVSLASMIAVVAAAGVTAWLAHKRGALQAEWPVWGMTAALAGLIIARHRANLVRLLKGQEPKIGRRPPAAGHQETNP